MRQTLLLFFLFFIISGGEGIAQKYPILHYTTREGLSQMQVMATFRDSRGYLWVGTKHGFCKFNGESFERFPPDNKTIGWEVNGFAEDRKGNLYIQSEFVTRFNGHQFAEIKKAPGEYRELCIDDHDRVFCRNNSKGELNIIVNDSLVALQWPSLKNRKIRWLTYDKLTHSLIANVDTIGLVRITPQRLTSIAKLSTSNKLINNEIWLRSLNGQGVIHRQFQTVGEQFFAQFGTEGWQPFLQINNNKCEVLRSVPFDWLFSCNGKTILLEANTQRVMPIFSNEFNHNTLTNTAYGTWIGSEKGLVFVVQNGIRYFPDSEVPYPWSVVEDAKKQMWFLNFSHPIQRFDGQRIKTVTGYAEKMIRQLQVSKVPNIISNQDQWYYGALRDKHGNIWLPNGNGVLWHDGKRFEFLVRPAYTNPASITFSLLEDPNRNVVLQGAQGVVHIFENRPPFRTASLTEKEGLTIKSYIFSMALEQSGIYWFGGGQMLSRYDAAQKQWTEYSAFNKKLNAGGVFDLEFDNRGTLWAGTVTQGLTYLDTRRDTVRNVEAIELREPVNSVMLLDNDHLLISSLRNLYVMDLKTWYASKKVVLKCFNHHNGFMGIEPGQNGLYKDSKGHVWVMAGTALSVIDPKKIDLTPGQLRTYTTKLNGQLLPFTAFSKDSVFALPFGTGDVRVEFESVGEDKSFQSQYSYFVEGLTDGWTPWQEEPVATLTHLASGTYIIHIKSRTGGTEANNSQEAILHFAVRVWPWESPYFPYYASFLLIALLATGGYIYWRNQQQVRREKRIAREQAEKVTQQEQMVKVLEVQTAQAQMHPHFIFNVLNTLQGLVYKQETVRANEHIVKLGELMRSYLSASLSLDGSRESLERGMITLEQEIKLLQMYIDFEQLQYRDRFEVSIEIDPHLSPDFYRIPPLLIQPFVENAIKHGVLGDPTRKGNVWIRFWMDLDETLVCEVEDDGIGRKAAQLRKENAYQTHRSEGTNLVKNRVTLLNQLNFYIDIQTTDRPERGTHVVIRMNDRIS